jgi:DNA polymerase-1
MKPLLLIDGDILIYKAISSVEQEIEFEPDVWVMMTDLNDAKDAFVTQLTNLIMKVDGCEPKICVSDPDANFRKEIYPQYKANRKAQRKPMGFKAFRQWVLSSYPCLSKPSLEADDVLGILATKPGNNAVIYSIDKDLKQIPGKHLVDGEVITVTEAEGDYLHLMQTLTGDPVDGYPGCPGIGKAKAEKLLNLLADCEDDFISCAWQLVVEAYEKAGLTEEDALVQARVARILRWDDWDQASQQVKLWSPK